MKATPGPWKLCCDGKCSCLIISGEHHPIAKIYSGKWGDDYPALRIVGPSLDQKVEAYLEQITYGEISNEEALANARLIVRAVNLHEKPLEALRKIAKPERREGLMLCPMRSQAIKVQNNDEHWPYFWDCERERCAWWNGNAKLGQCAILSIARHLGDLPGYGH